MRNTPVFCRAVAWLIVAGPRRPRPNARVGTPRLLVKTSRKILHAVRQNPQVTIPELSAQVGVTTSSIERNLQKLQHEKRLRRIGPAKGGHWEVLE